MASILHGNAKTTPRIRKEIQESEESIAALAKKYNINFKTVLYWKHADSVEDKKSGPKPAPACRPSRSSRQYAPSGDTCGCHWTSCISSSSPIFRSSAAPICTAACNITDCRAYPRMNPTAKKAKRSSSNIRSALSISTLPRCAVKPANCTCLSPSTAKPNIFHAELHQRMTQKAAVSFLRNLQQDCVFKITHILTDNGVQFTYNLLNEAQRPDKEHPFDELKRHLMVFLLYYNHQRPLRSLKYKTPWQALEDCYHLKPEWFHENPFQKIVGLNNYLYCLRLAALLAYFFELVLFCEFIIKMILMS